MAHYIFVGSSAQATELLQAGMWGVEAGELHRDELNGGDLVLVYVGAPERMFVGRAALASSAHEWTPSEAGAYPGGSVGGVLLTDVEEWGPPVPMSAVLARIDRSAGARADFDTAIVRITEGEYETALAVAAERRR